MFAMSTIYNVRTLTLFEAYGVLVQALVNMFSIGVNVNHFGLNVGPSLLAVTPGSTLKD